MSLERPARPPLRKKPSPAAWPGVPAHACLLPPQGRWRASRTGRTGGGAGPEADPVLHGGKIFQTQASPVLLLARLVCSTSFYITSLHTFARHCGCSSPQRPTLQLRTLPRLVLQRLPLLDQSIVPFPRISSLCLVIFQSSTVTATTIANLSNLANISPPPLPLV